MTLNFLDFISNPESNFSKHNIRTLADLNEVLEHRVSMGGWSVQNLDVSTVDFTHANVSGMFLLGCSFASSQQKLDLIERGAFVFPRLIGLPYNPYRSQLYTAHELLDGWEDGGYKKTSDFEIYEFINQYSDEVMRAPVHLELAQRIHDHAIDDALASFIRKHKGKGIVGIMGGHAARRDAAHYREVAMVTWKLTRQGYLIASGGGPGVMEAANMGAYFACYANSEAIDEAIKMIEHVPTFEHSASHTINDYVESAMEVVKRFRDPSPEDSERFGYDAEVSRYSLAVPTWFYGHEPTNLFSNAIAKYFANSIREDGLLAICDAGVIYAPGGAGTMQEVFIDLSQNHYAMGNKRSPMVFLGKESFGTINQLVMEFVENHQKMDEYGDMITIVNSGDEAVKFIQKTPARRVERYDKSV